MPEEVVPAKRCKLEECQEGREDAPQYEHNSKDMKIVRVLNHNPSHKSIVLHATFANNSEDAVVILEKTAFPKEITTLSSHIGSSVTPPTAVLTANGDEKCPSKSGGFSWNWVTCMHNDVYHKYRLELAPQLNATCEEDKVSGVLSTAEMKATLIHPASQRQIDKYLPHNLHLVQESPVDYLTITKPHYESQQFDNAWIHNILDGVAEADRIILQDDDFVLLKDYKWDGRMLEELYCLVLVKDRQLKSIRDLCGANHVTLLTKIWQQGGAAIESKYGIKKSQLKMYAHYQPQFYHFHVHVNQLSTESTQSSSVGRAHLIQDIIFNLEKDPTYYQTATLHFTLAENDPLYAKLCSDSYV